MCLNLFSSVQVMSWKRSIEIRYLEALRNSDFSILKLTKNNSIWYYTGCVLVVNVWPYCCMVVCKHSTIQVVVVCCCLKTLRNTSCCCVFLFEDTLLYRLLLLFVDTALYGLCPAWDEFYLAVCERCQLLIKPQALQNHIGNYDNLPYL